MTINDTLRGVEEAYMSIKMRAGHVDTTVDAARLEARATPSPLAGGDSGLVGWGEAGIFFDVGSGV